MPLSAGSRLGRYKIRSKLGAGGIGEVYLAEDIELGRTIALKVLPEEAANNQQRMQRFIIVFMKAAPMFDSLKSDPRYQEIARQTGLP